MYKHASGVCRTPLESSCRGGHFEYRLVYTRAIDMPSAVADIEPIDGHSGHGNLPAYSCTHRHVHRHVFSWLRRHVCVHMLTRMHVCVCTEIWHSRVPTIPPKAVCATSHAHTHFCDHTHWSSLARCLILYRLCIDSISAIANGMSTVWV